ncbi:MAG: hypothetical protein RTU09_07795 [Candidatus Thorarchaeota archaeon]
MNEDIVRYVSLVRKDGGEPVLGITFREMRVDPDLVASFVLAIVIFENQQLRTFIKEGYVVVIEEGNHVVGLLIIDKTEDDEPYREALRGIIKEFEVKHELQLTLWRGDIRPFKEFGIDILGVFPYKRFDWQLVPRLIKKSDATPDCQESIPWSVGETNKKIQTVIGFINGKRTIREIVKSSGYSEAELTAIFAMLDRYKWITLSRRANKDSVLVKLTSTPKRLIGVYGDQLDGFVELCDGTRTLEQVCELVPFDIEVLMTIAKNLIDTGVLGYGKRASEGGESTE